MQTKFKDIAQYYLGTGLECRADTSYSDWESHSIFVLDTISVKDGLIFKYDIYRWDEVYEGRIKPLLRSLDSLTKPITVKGYNYDKEFVPIEEIGELDYDTYSLYYYKNHAIRLPFELIQLLLKWHFNIFNLEETEYIKID